MFIKKILGKVPKGLFEEMVDPEKSRAAHIKLLQDRIGGRKKRIKFCRLVVSVLDWHKKWHLKTIKEHNDAIRRAQERIRILNALSEGSSGQ